MFRKLWTKQQKLYMVETVQPNADTIEKDKITDTVSIERLSITQRKDKNESR